MRQLSLFALTSLLAFGSAVAQEENLDPAKDAPPRLLKQVRAKPTREALAKELEGIVLVEYVIDEEGKVQSPRVLESIPVWMSRRLRRSRNGSSPRPCPMASA